jgi:DNA modification methylase
MSKILLGDCIKVMNGMDENSVDLVFGSPPYEDARTYGIDFKLKGQEWVDWMVEVYKASLRVSKGLVAFVVQGRTKQFRWTASPVLLMADLHRAGIHLRNPPLYYRSGIPGQGGPDWLRSDYEWIICAAQPGKLAWSDNTAMGHPPKCRPGGKPTHRKKNGERVRLTNGGMRLPNGTPRKHGYTINTIKLANPGNVIKCSGGHCGSKLAHENEAPFPEKLAEFFVKSFCPPGYPPLCGTVLDPFMGSGTTLAVAKKNGRRGIGIDIRESQVELTKRRLNE